MSQYLPKLLADGQLPATKSTLYTVPAAMQTMIKGIVFVNTVQSSITVNIYIKKNGVSRRIIPIDTILEIGFSLETDLPYFIEAGVEVEADASMANAVDYTIYGVEQV